MPLLPRFAALGDESFVSLTTFRKSGEGVSVPVWIARDGDSLIVTTPDGTGKVKRIRNNGRVELRPCDRRGKVADGVVPIEGTAVIERGSAAEEHLTAIFLAKYKLEYRAFMQIEKVVGFVKKQGADNKRRVLLRITPAD